MKLTKLSLAVLLAVSATSSMAWGDREQGMLAGAAALLLGQHLLQADQVDQQQLRQYDPAMSQQPQYNQQTPQYQQPQQQYNSQPQYQQQPPQYNNQPQQQYQQQPRYTNQLPQFSTQQPLRHFPNQGGSRIPNYRSIPGGYMDVCRFADQQAFIYNFSGHVIGWQYCN
jgi:hypothetical protein